MTLAAWASMLILFPHLLCVNTASALPLLAAWLLFRERHLPEGAAARLARRQLVVSLIALVVGMLLGGVLVGLLMFEADSPLMEIFRRLPSIRYAFIASELAFSAICVALAIPFCRPDRPTSRPRRWSVAALAVLSSTNLLYHFPALFVALSHLASQGVPAEIVFDAATLRELRFDPYVVMLGLHHVVAALATAGGWLMFDAAFTARQRLELTETSSAATVRLGAWWVLLPSLLQGLVGLLVLTRLPAAEQQALMGEDLLATSLFAVSLLGYFVLLQGAAHAAFGGVTRKGVLRTLLLLGGVIFVMTLTVDRLRRQHTGTPRPPVAVLPAEEIRGLP